MIYGNVNNAMFEKQAAVLPAPLSAALHFLKETDLASHEAGVFNIELGGVPVILQVLDLNTAPRETLRPEIHRKNIDVQFLAAGKSILSDGCCRIGKRHGDKRGTAFKGRIGNGS